PLAASIILTTPLKSPRTSFFPSGLNATRVHSLPDLVSLRSSSPVLRSHTPTNSLQPAQARRFPSGENCKPRVLSRPGHLSVKSKSAGLLSLSGPSSLGPPNANARTRAETARLMISSTFSIDLEVLSHSEHRTATGFRQNFNGCEGIATIFPIL